MTIVDTSILVEMILNPADRERLVQALRTAAPLAMSTFTVYETSVVLLARFGWEGVTKLHQLLDSLRIEIVDFTAEYANASAKAYAQFGKGFHPAKLNSGDCPVYALARERDASLMFKGGDFSKADLPRTLPL